PGGLVSAREAGAVTHRALRIDVDEQRFHSAARECGGEIYCGSGFANSSLLAYDSEDSSHLLENPGVLARLHLGTRRWRRLSAFHLIQCLLCVFNPSLRFGPAWRIHEKGFEMIGGVAHIAAPE